MGKTHTNIHTGTIKKKKNDKIKAIMVKFPQKWFLKINRINTKNLQLLTSQQTCTNKWQNENLKKVRKSTWHLGKQNDI